MEDQRSPPEVLHTENSRFLTHAGSSSDAGLDTEEVRSLGPRNVIPDQPAHDPSTTQGALPSPEAEDITILSKLGPLVQDSVHTTENKPLTPPNALTEPPTQKDKEDMSALNDNHVVGSPGMIRHTTNWPHKGLPKKVTRINSTNRTTPPLQDGRSMTALASHAALDQSYAALETTGIEEWPMLPGQGAQDLHSPSLEPTAMPRENSACNLMDLPTAIQPHEEGLHETAKGSTEQGMISSEETYMDHHGASEPMTPDTMIKVPDAAQSATEACTLTRRQRGSQKQKAAR